MRISEDEISLRVVKELESLSINNEFIDEYDYENVQRKLMNSIKDEVCEDGVLDGKKREKQEIAKKMLEVGE